MGKIMRSTKATTRNEHTTRLATGRIAGAGIMALLLVLVAPLVCGAGEHTGEPINLNLEEADLRDVLQTFGMLSDLRVVLDPRAVVAGLLDVPVSTRIVDRPWDAALDDILLSHGLTAVPEGGMLWILPAGEMMTGNRTFDGEPISMRLKGADLGDVLASFSRLTEVPIVSDPGVAGSVDLTVSDTPWDQVLDLIIRITGHDYLYDGEEIRVFVAAGGAAAQLLPAGCPKHQPLHITGEGDTIHRYVVGGPVSEPKRISGPDPVYPTELKDEGDTGAVVIKVIVATDGSVHSLAAVNSTVPPAMIEAASEAVRQWRFTPGTIGGEPVAVEYLLTVRFTLEEQ